MFSNSDQDCQKRRNEMVSPATRVGARWGPKKLTKLLTSKLANPLSCCNRIVIYQPFAMPHKLVLANRGRPRPDGLL